MKYVFILKTQIVNIVSLITLIN